MAPLDGAYDSPVDDRGAAIEEVCRHCDLAERLTLVPPSVRTRGLYIRSIEAVLTRAGHFDRYHRLFPERFSAIPMHPLGEFLVRLAVGGALLTEPARVHE